MNRFRRILHALRLVSAVACFATPGLSSAQQYLYSYPVSPAWRDNYTGGSGCLFTVGATNVVVSHLGYFSTNTATGLQTSHPVGVYDASVHLLGQVTVPAGKSAYYVGKFYWEQLDPPLLLSANTAYYVAALPVYGDGDWWGDSFAPSWFTWIVGSQASSTRQTAYAPGGTTWPVTSFTTFGNNTTYLLEGLANLAQGPAKVGLQTNLVVATATNQTLSVVGFASGATTITYQWWLAPNTRLPTQTNATLYLTNATTGTYFLTASNSLGGEQSPNVTVAVSPAVLGQLPQITASPILLFTGANPTFSLSSVAGIHPFSYQWTANGVPISGATNTAYTLTNAQASGPTHFACVVTNLAGSTTSLVWNLSISARPTAPYPAAVLADQPIAYWPLNEADNGAGNNGAAANDYLGAKNGVYTNTVLAQSGYAQGLASQYGYTPATDSEPCAWFGSFASHDSDANSIYGVDFSAPSGSNVTFSVEAWVNGMGYTANAGIASKGYFYNEEFSLDTGAPSNCYRFAIRNASGTAYNANSSIGSGDNLWHHLVGVCDQPNSAVKLYIDGVLAGTANIATGSGLMASDAAVPMIIGARPTTATSGADNQFQGYINDVALYNFALSSSQVVTHFLAAGIGAYLTVQPPASTNVNEGSTLVVPAQAIGTPQLSYQWYDVTSGSPGTPIQGQTSATLVISSISAAAYDGHAFALTVSNRYGQATSQPISVTVIPGPPASVAIAPPALSVYAGLPVLFTVTAQGSQPFSYQWALDGTPVAGATNSTYTNAAPAGNHTLACTVTNHLGVGSPAPATASLSGVAYPTDNYGVHVLNDQPLAFWRLDELANAPTAYDLVGGHNASYFNVVNALPGFSAQDPDTAAGFGMNGLTYDSVAIETDNSGSGIGNIDFSTQGTNAHFSLEAWINAPPGQKNGAALLVKGYGNGGEQFCLDVFNNGHYRFFIRNANNTVVRTAQSPNLGPDGNWHHLAAVCDQAHGWLYLYIDGALNATGATVPGEGIQGPLPATGPVLTSIGSGMVNATDSYSYQLTNAVMDEVAIYNYALSSNQVAAHYSAATEPPRLLTDLDSQYLWYASIPLDLSVLASGNPPLAYQWQRNGTNLSDGATLSGSHSNTLVISPTALADSAAYNVVITNQSGAVTSTVASVTFLSRLEFYGFGSGWSGNGGAQFPFSDYVELTGNGSGSASSFFSSPVYVGGFQASFTYEDIGGGGADGMAFVVQNDARGDTALGGGGGGLGYNGITNSAAVEFNIYSANGVGFAVRTNGVTGPPYASTAPVNLASGDLIDVSLTYRNGVLSLSLSDAAARTSFTTNLSLSLPAVVGGNSAYVGFTGGEGVVASQQFVSDFSYVGLIGLAIEPAASQGVTLSWPTEAGGYVLQQSAALNPTSWTNVATSPVSAGQVNQVTLPASTTRAFYRLINNP